MCSFRYVSDISGYFEILYHSKTDPFNSLTHSLCICFAETCVLQSPSWPKPTASVGDLRIQPRLVLASEAYMPDTGAQLHPRLRIAAGLLPRTHHAIRKGVYVPGF